MSKAYPILYDYKPYSFVRRGVFCLEAEPAKYTAKGWAKVEKEHLIIGETDDIYVTRLLKSSHGEWVGDVVVQRRYTLPIGIHKTRLVKWVTGQLSLFDHQNISRPF